MSTIALKSRTGRLSLHLCKIVVSLALSYCLGHRKSVYEFTIIINQFMSLQAVVYFGTGTRQPQPSDHLVAGSLRKKESLAKPRTLSLDVVAGAGRLLQYKYANKIVNHTFQKFRCLRYL